MRGTTLGLHGASGGFLNGSSAVVTRVLVTAAARPATAVKFGAFVALLATARSNDMVAALVFAPRGRRLRFHHGSRSRRRGQ